MPSGVIQAGFNYYSREAGLLVDLIPLMDGTALGEFGHLSDKTMCILACNAEHYVMCCHAGMHLVSKKGGYIVIILFVVICHVLQ